MSINPIDGVIEIRDSEWIESVRYNPDTLTLDVKTRAGVYYRYQRVGTDTFAKLVCSQSSGRFFNDAIKGKYDRRKFRGTF